VAGWLDALLDARTRLAAVRERLAAQLGGAAGTLAGFGGRGPEALEAYAAGLGLAEPPLPWHAHRGRVAELAAALQQTAGTAAKIALDVILLAQSEVAEVAEAAGGASSTMPQKQNPAGSAIARACARLASANASLLAGGLEHEHERAAGAWQAEWPALTAALAYMGGAVAAVRGVLDGLRVDEERMRRNLDAAGGAVLAERLVFLLTPRIGREQALRSVRDALASPAGLRDALLADPAAGLEPEELDEALDPATAMGAATALVDRALARHRGGDAR
jgi:3-carboxy-cis,cis-muconate cycloisomerase